ncbi:MAG TPA: 6-bladed beta-propeller [Candidatus Cloacimonadota bacterium]|nr:6-bladed beta-propeller [Bacteroidales bacterium]HPM01636.1 6-bladed beta-propeller [Candidatus Cloacimonadota bacterium]
MKIKCLFLSILLISCKSNTNTIYEFDPRVLKENKASLTEIADDIIYIPLDNDFPISLIYSPKYFINNSIYLSALNAGVMVFDRQGRLIRKIGRIGRGPGEYARYYIFTVDNKNETVYIMDSGANFIKVYSKEGNFLRNISLKDYGNGVDAVEFFNSKLIISYHSQFRDIKNDLIVLDTLGNFIDKKERIDIPFTSNWLIDGGLYEYENHLSRWSPFTDTIYSIFPDLNYGISFVFGKGEHRLPKSNIDINKIKIYFNPYMVFETHRFLVFRYLYNEKVTLALVEKRSNKSYVTYLESGPAVVGNNFIGGIANDLDGGTPFQPENYFVEGNREYMVGLINSYQIKTLVASAEFKNSTPKYPEKKKKLITLADSLKETDNPVLMLVRLKD